MFRAPRSRRGSTACGDAVPFGQSGANLHGVERFASLSSMDGGWEGDAAGITEENVSKTHGATKTGGAITAPPVVESCGMLPQRESR